MSDGSGPLTQDQALALVARTTDPNWIAGMLGQPDGQAIINALVAVGAAASERLMDQVAACSIDTAPYGHPGNMTLTLARPDTTATALIPAGFTVTDSRGIDLILLEDIWVVAHQTTIVLPMQSLRLIDLVNNTEPAFDDMLTVGGSVDAAIAPQSAPVYDSANQPLLVKGTSIATYLSSTPIISAEMDWLSAHGDERGCHRQNGEEGEAYRLRVRSIQDAITPVAIQAGVRAAQSQGKLSPIWMVESMNDQSSTDARTALSLAYGDTVFLDADYFDDPIGVHLDAKAPWNDLEMVSAREARAYFRLSMAGKLTESGADGYYFDDGFFDDPVWGFYDSTLAMSGLGSLITVTAVANQLRAAGVKFDFYIEDDDVLPPTGEIAGGGVCLSWTTVFTYTADVGTAWVLREGLVSHTAGQVGAVFHRVKFTFTDSTEFTTEEYDGIDSERLSFSKLASQGYPFKPIAKIEGELLTTAAPADLFGTFWAVTIIL